MERWADWLISGVHYNSSDKIFIDTVHIHNEISNKISLEFRTLKRSELVSLFDKGDKIITITKRDGFWLKGQQIRKILVRNIIYLRTDSNRMEEDLLENLPLF